MQGMFYPYFCLDNIPRWVLGAWVYGPDSHAQSLWHVHRGGGPGAWDLRTKGGSELSPQINWKQRKSFNWSIL